MEREQLFFGEMSHIVGSDGLSAVVLTDKPRERALTVVLDRAMSDQLSLRLKGVPVHTTMLPEVLLSMFDAETVVQMEMMVYDVSGGQYKVTLLNRLTLTLRNIRMSDAILLALIAHIPLYIDAKLFTRQSSPYEPGCQGLQIPINAIDSQRLNVELEKAIAKEDYRLASQLHNELKRRDGN